MGWFFQRKGDPNKAAREPGEPLAAPEDSDDLLTLEEFRILLSPEAEGHTRVLREFCLRAIPVFRGVALRQMAERGQSGRQLDGDLVNDLIEECLKNDKRTLRKWDPARSPLRYFLRLLAHRRIADKLRGRRYGRSSEKAMEAAELANLPQEDFEHAVSAEERDFWKKYRAQFLAKAPAEDQALYQCFYVDGESAESLTGRLGISVVALHKRLSRLRALMFRLRDELLDEDQ